MDAGSGESISIGGGGGVTKNKSKKWEIKDLRIITEE
jgi:hypothetical protein